MQKDRSIAAGLHSVWSEIEHVLTVATGPLLILSATTAAADIFSHGALSVRWSWLPLAWAAARAVAVTIFLGVAYDHYLAARHKGDSGRAWFALTAVLFFVDLQTGILFGVETEHIADIGMLGQINLSPLGWLIETGLLTIILIPVTRAIEFNRKLAAHPTQPQINAEPTILYSAPPQPTPAFFSGPTFHDFHDPLTWREPQPRQPRQTPQEGAEGVITSNPVSSTIQRETEPPIATRRRRGPRRSDSGQTSPEKNRRIALLVHWLKDDPNMSVADCEAALHVAGFPVSRPTVILDRREAKRQLAEATA